MAHSKNYKFVFLDLDDTIWDFHANARLALSDVFVQRNLDLYFQDFDQFFGIYEKRNTELWEQYAKGEVSKDFLMVERFRYPLAQMGVDNAILAQEIGTQYLEILPTKKSLVPFALDLLQYLSDKNYPLTVISNGFVEVQYKKMRSSNIEHYFRHIVLSESAGALKPDKKIFEYALKLNAASASQAVMIGDSFSADIMGAQNAGIDQIYLPSSHSSDVNSEPKCTYTVRSLNEILDIL